MRILGALLLGLCSELALAIVPPPGAVDPRVREIDYRESQVVSLQGFVGYHIHIELSPAERFVALGVGDSDAVDVAAEGPHIMLKPKAKQVATNLTLVSSRRVYHFDYRASTARPDPAAMFTLRFRYPAPVEVTPVATTDEPIEAAPPRVINRDYWYCGSSALRPVEASDDGSQTRVQFQARGEWPAIFVKNDDGTESLVNFHIEETTAVVHRVAREFVLRRGGLVGCVENRGFAGGGEWLPAQTADPAMRREVAQ
jgi:type IV secretion system protein VirB9